LYFFYISIGLHYQLIKTTIMKKIILSLTAVCLSAFTMANNIAVANASLTGQDIGANTTIINFDVSWDNSWRTNTNENNYDGAWVFVKFRKMGTLDWRHCTISSTGFIAAAGGAISVPTDGKGAFIYKSSATGVSNVIYLGNQLIWNYGVDGILDNETVEIRVFALEMVYIPQGTFQLGSGGTEVNVFKTGATSTPFDVTAATITFGTTGSNLNTNGNGPTTGTLAAAYPTGFNAFWIMKYETSQQQYVDFLNHIDLARATFNDNVGIRAGTHPNFTANQPERTAGNCNAQRLAAMADWSGLRPFTEMEFEKACRGYNTPAVPNEFVWGNTTANNLTAVTNTGLSNESVSAPAAANINVGGSYNVPSRVGLFARATGSTRALGGGTYYGVMDMGGNAAEICINTVGASGLAFDGSLHGDGYLAASGASNISNWTTFGAYGWKGGDFSNAVGNARISDRGSVNLYTAIYGSDAVIAQNGIRLARTAP
jgi:formylglycine-generating enzyme required for sulfatase activity